MRVNIVNRQIVNTMKKAYIEPLMEVMRLNFGQQLLAGSVGIDDLGGDGFSGGGGGDGTGDSEPRAPFLDEDFDFSQFEDDEMTF